MKTARIAFIVLAAICPWHGMQGQTTGENRIREMRFEKGYSYDGDIEVDVDANVDHSNIYTYYDGMGREVQRLTNREMPDARYVCTRTAYNTRGLKSESWVPVPAGTVPGIMPPGSAAEASTRFYGDSKGYTLDSYDATGRPAQSTMPGTAWHSAAKGQSWQYASNTAGEVRKFSAPLEKVSLVSNGFHPAGSLTKEVCTDADGHSVAKFTDMLGHVVLERRGNDNDTYFVYNDLGMLRYVLSPEYQNAGYKAKYAYEYRYDAKGRMVKRILPGCEYEQFWYDDEDRMTFMQDATLRDAARYRFFIYDRMGRMAVSGTCSSCVRDGYVLTCRPCATGEGFAGTGYEVDGSERITDVTIETADYYDNYSFLDALSSRFPIPADSMTAGATEAATTRHTGRMLACNDGGWMVETRIYDAEGRMTARREADTRGNMHTWQVALTFTGKPEREVERFYSEHAANSMPLMEGVTSYSYSKNGVLMAKEVAFAHQGGESSGFTETYTYDDIGRLTSVQRGTGGKMSYEYDIHGWPVHTKGPGYEASLHYADGLGTPCYNGNVSSMAWTAPDYAKVRSYRYSYDYLDRLKEASYAENADMSANPGRYDEKIIRYTANGAIERFQRKGLKDNGVYGKIDNLSLEMDGNRPVKVTDDALPVNRYATADFKDGADIDMEYTYNGVGALTSDANKGIDSIRYDLDEPSITHCLCQRKLHKPLLYGRRDKARGGTCDKAGRTAPNAGYRDRTGEPLCCRGACQLCRQLRAQGWRAADVPLQRGICLH